MTDAETKPGLEKGPAPEAAPRKAGVLTTIIQLTVASLLVGAVLAMIGLSPIDFWTGLADTVRHFVEGILNLGWSTVSTVITYIILGAMIVIPVWGVAKLLSLGTRR